MYRAKQETKDDENEETQDFRVSLLSGRYAELFDEKIMKTSQMMAW